MKYPKGTPVKVYEGSRMVETFRLREGMRCITSVRRMVYRLYPYLDHSKIMVVMGG